MAGVEAGREMAAALASMRTSVSVSNVLGVNVKSTMASKDSIACRQEYPLRITRTLWGRWPGGGGASGGEGSFLRICGFG